MEMVKSRNLTSHTYNMETASFVENDIKRKYHQAFKKLIERFESEN
ncbi:nucleotidyltransferase substrate binding protein [Algoriphagus antarcticus]